MITVCIVGVHVTWSEEEKAAVINTLRRHVIAKESALNMKECMIAKMAHPELLKNRTWRNIKDFCRNSRSKYF